jgi:hypothetical protein
MGENQQTLKILPKEGIRLRVQRRWISNKTWNDKYYTVDCTRDSHGRRLTAKAWIRCRQILFWVCGDHVALGQLYLQDFFTAATPLCCSIKPKRSFTKNTTTYAIINFILFNILLCFKWKIILFSSPSFSLLSSQYPFLHLA